MNVLNLEAPKGGNGVDPSQQIPAYGHDNPSDQAGPGNGNGAHPGDSENTERAQTCKDAFDRLDQLIVTPDDKWSTISSQALTLKLERPSKQAIFRVSPDLDDHLQVYLLKAKEDAPVGDGFYLVQQSMISLLVEIGLTPQRHVLFSAIRRPDNTHFMIPARLPEGESPRADECAEAYLQAMAMAQDSWIRMRWDRKIGDYIVDEIMDDGSTPVFPKIPDADRLRKMFGQSRLIDSEDHPVFMKLKGAA